MGKNEQNGVIKMREETQEEEAVCEQRENEKQLRSKKMPEGRK